MQPFQRLLDFKKDSVVCLASDGNRVVVAPDMGGRVFVEAGGLSVHRIHWPTVEQPDRPFNNFGGMNLWPAPEGGAFGFNYLGNEWRVQSAINNESFSVCRCRDSSVVLAKHATLINRRGTDVEVTISRDVRLVAPAPCLEGQPLAAVVAVETQDSMAVQNQVSSNEALIAAWNLEQFDATEETVAFVRVASPRNAVNFDFYEPPPFNLIAWYDAGFTFRVNGRQRGQIGLRHAARPELIGFYDATACLLCLKENTGPIEGLFFNIADNDQPSGVYSAADSYSIFNSDADMAAFELETVGPLILGDGRLLHSSLTSRSTYAVFPDVDSLRKFVQQLLGVRSE